MPSLIAQLSLGGKKIRGKCFDGLGPVKLHACQDQECEISPLSKAKDGRMNGEKSFITACRALHICKVLFLTYARHFEYLSLVVAQRQKHWKNMF